MKIQVKSETTTVARTTVRVDRRVIKSDSNANNIIPVGSNGNHSNNGYFNLRQRLGSPAQLPARVLRNTESGSSAMKRQHTTNNNHQTNGGIREVTSPDRVVKKGGTHHNHDNIVINGGGRAASSETKNGSSSVGGSDIVWPPKFMIALTNKEKEEDFMAIKGSKLPQRPKKRAKFCSTFSQFGKPGRMVVRSNFRAV